MSGTLSRCNAAHELLTMAVVHQVFHTDRFCDVIRMV